MSEVVRLVADLGSGQVTPTVPDPMAGPAYGGTPDTPPIPGDSTVTSPPPSVGPGFMGEYLVRDEGIWWSVDGSQENTLEHEGGDCTQQRVNFDYAEFSCEAIQLHFRFTMTVQRFNVLPMEGWNPRDSVLPAPDAGIEGDHDGAGQRGRCAAHHPAVDDAADAGRFGADAAATGPTGADADAHRTDAAARLSASAA